MNATLFCTLLAAAALLPGCSSSAADKADAGGSATGQQALTDADPPQECPDRGATIANSDTYVAGMEKTGKRGLLKVALVEALPTPPAQGDNTWKIRVTDPAGAPILGASFDWTMSPWMPCHQHSPNDPPEATATDADGNYEIAKIDFFMPGIWTTTFDVAVSDDARDSATFQFVVER